MPRLEFDHLYRETLHWEDSVAFWERLGFRFSEQWGAEPHRAGTLVHGDSSVVLAEVAPGSEPVATTFLATDALTELAAATATVAETTHWGTTMITTTDPDGRVYHIEGEDPA